MTAAPGPEFRLDAVPTRLPHSNSHDYAKALAALQQQLRRLQLAYLSQDQRGVIVFEGFDAAGKGGVIRRMAGVLEPRACAFHPVGPPDPTWQGRHWLARFWPLLPEPSHMSVFDRSWYGRVLVERVEDLTDRHAWERAYDEINTFEAMLLDDGVRVVKLFMHMSADEQLRRFQERLNDPVKRFKLTMADIHSRELRPAYEHAVQDMVRRTTQARAPWHVIPADDKKAARLRALQVIFEGLSAGLDLVPPPLDPHVARAAGTRLGLKLPGEGS
jgi:polyphosphate kinase 2 (PPK2 family)